MPKSPLDQLSINALRVLAMDAVEHAHSGHPGLPLGMADVAYVLWTHHLKHNPKNPHWPNRDRFVLSAGHGSALLYALLHLTGYPLSLADLRLFRQMGSKTPGYPERSLELGVEATTGLPGQGFANAVGMAIAQAHLALTFNRPAFPIFHHEVYALISEGEMMAGLTHEAASLAGHLGLERLICVYDANHISRDGSTDLAVTEEAPERFRTYGWHVQEIDGHDVEAIDAALRAARETPDRPHLVVAHTHIGYGSPHKQGTAAAHGAPLGQEEVRLTKEALEWPSQEPFFVPDQVRVNYRLAVPRGEQEEARWRELLTGYDHEHPQEMRELRRILTGELPEGWAQRLPTFKVSEGPFATRAASGRVLNDLAPAIPELLGGSADLAGETYTLMKGVPNFQRETPEGRNLRFGVREHAMGAVLNGLALYGGLRAYGGTYLALSDYMRPAIRMAALMKLPVIYLFSHDSVLEGQDGPTLQPVEHLLTLRAIPHLTVVRPADANETAAAWKVALEEAGPVALLLSRQQLPILEGTEEKALEGVAHGAYVLSDPSLERIDLILIASGSEVTVALEAQRLLAARQVNARVVSMPCWNRFDEQTLFYRLNVLPPTVPKRLAIEAGLPIGWGKYVGPQGAVMGVNDFGASAPGYALQERFGLTPDRVAERALHLLAE